ncbi:ABC transporter permease [bacterium]|nr:ABC transporter permease [bacterium]
MKEYTIRRLLALIPTLFLATLVVFFVIRLIPGDIIDQMLAESNAFDADITRERLMHSLGLDLPVHVQYFEWIKGIVLDQNLGKSLWDGRDLTDDLSKMLPVSIELALIALIISLIVALPIGVLSAIRQETRLDYLGRTFSILGLSVPGFWIGTMAIVLPSIWWGWSPPIEVVSFFEDPLENLQMFLIPGCIMGLVFSAVIMRMTRAMMLEVLRQDYIRTAWAKGANEKIVIIRHALKNALIPVVTVIGLQIPELIAGLVVMEQIFSLPGIGSLILESILLRDYPFVIGLMLLMGLLILIINLLVDVSYGLLDPKVKFKR